MVTTQYCEDRDPLISVLLPISRLDEYFELALASIFNQTYSKFEVLVLANGVSDDEYSRISQLCSIDSRVVLYRLTLRGLVFALNYGIDRAAGTYIARMDADDISALSRFEEQVKFLQANPDYGVVGGRVNLIDGLGSQLGRKFKFYSGNDQIYKVLPFRNPMCHPGLMFRKLALLNVLGYRFGFMSEDHEMFIRMMQAGIKFENIDHLVLSYRRHDAQITDISNAAKHFSEISSFMWMHFYNTKRFKYLLGALAVHPLVRRVRGYLLGFLSK